MGFIKEVIDDFLSRYDTAAYVRIKHRPIAILQGCAFILVGLYVVLYEVIWNESYLKEVKINPYVHASVSNVCPGKYEEDTFTFIRIKQIGSRFQMIMKVGFFQHGQTSCLKTTEAVDVSMMVVSFRYPPSENGAISITSVKFYNKMQCALMNTDGNCVKWEQYEETETSLVWGLEQFQVEIDHGFTVGDKLISSSNMTSAKLFDHNGDEVILNDGDCMGKSCMVDLGDPEFEEEIKPYVDLSVDNITLVTLMQAAGIGFDKEEYFLRRTLGIAILASFEYKHPKKLFFFSDTSKYEYTITMKKLPSATVANAVLQQLNETHAVEITRSCIRIVFEAVNKIYKFDLMSLILSFSAGGTVLGFVTIALDFVSKNFIRGKSVVSTMVYQETDNLHLLSTAEIVELNDKIQRTHRRDKFLRTEEEDPEAVLYAAPGYPENETPLIERGSIQL